MYNGGSSTGLIKAIFSVSLGISPINPNILLEN
jgi:hypothetical protein